MPVSAIFSNKVSSSFPSPSGISIQEFVSACLLPFISGLNFAYFVRLPVILPKSFGGGAGLSFLSKPYIVSQTTKFVLWYVNLVLIKRLKEGVSLVK